jgi:hypothetical protein
MFETLSIAESRPIAILKKSFFIIIIALLGIGAVSSYRAELAFFDPRSQQKSQTMVATNDQLRTFDPGPAIIRATATGRPQWTRLPPPTVIEKSVEIHRN